MPNEGMAPAQPTRDAMAPNRGVRVLQLSGGIEVAFCTKILADTGADVGFVEPARGHLLRHRDGGGGPGALFAYLHSGKRSIVNEREVGDALLARADVVVTDSLPGGWEEIHDRHPHLSVVAITPYGLEGPWAHRAATDLTLQAASGGMAPRGAPDRAPLMVGGEPSYWFAGAVAAVSLLGVLPRQSSETVGELIDVSIFEAAQLEHGMHPVTFWSMAQRPFQATRGTPVPGIEPTADGYVGFFVITGQQWLDFCALVGQPHWTEDESLFIASTRRERADDLLGPIREWTTAHTTADIVEVASLMRIPVAPIGNGATLPEIDQFIAEEWFVEDLGGLRQPRRPYRAVGEPVRRPAAPDNVGAGSVENWDPRPPPSVTPAAQPLSGVRVADFTGFWAGPMASGILAGLGADVIHIEGPTRPDGIRMNTIRAMSDDQWWEWSPLFCGANTNKRGLAVDLSTDEGRAVTLRLLEECDVMIENFSPRVVDQLGLGSETVLGVNRDLVVVRMPAFGLGGPWRDRVGFAQTIEQAVGLAFLTGYTDEAPLIPNGMCDPLAGVFGAIAALTGLAERSQTGAGVVIESPMVGAGLSTTVEQVIDFAVSGHLHTSMGNRSPWMEQDVFSCDGDDQWVAIAVPNEGVRVALREATDTRSVAELAEWCAIRSSSEVTDTLWPRGVPVSAVRWAHEIVDSPQIHHRGYLEHVDHPICGSHTYVSWPAQFSAGPHLWNRSASPTLGQHNREILSELGYSTETVAALYDGGVLAESVLNSQHGW